MRAVILEQNRKRRTVPSKILPSFVIMVLSDSRNIRVSIKSPMMSTSYQGNVHKCNEFQTRNDLRLFRVIQGKVAIIRWIYWNATSEFRKLHKILSCACRKQRIKYYSFSLCHLFFFIQFNTNNKQKPSLKKEQLVRFTDMCFLEIFMKTIYEVFSKLFLERSMHNFN